MGEKEKLINLLERGNLPNLIFADLRTFIFLKTSARDVYEEGIKEAAIGGGNFTSALISFISIDFLAQVYSYLRKGFPKEKELGVWYALLEKYPEVRDKYEELVKVGHLSEDWDWLNHVNGFKKLIADSQIWKTYSDSELGRIWNSYRDSLSHMACPKEAVWGLSFGDKISYKKYISKLEEVKEEPFEITEYSDILCLYPILFRDAQRLRSWLLEEIRKCEDEERISGINDWLRKNYPKVSGELN